MRRTLYARKKRHLKGLAKRLRYLLDQNSQELRGEIDLVVAKIRRLLKEMFGAYSRYDLRKVLGAAAVGLGLFYATETQAQNFAAPVENAFGLTAVQDYGFPVLADMDGDGDLDVLSGEYYGALKYFENTGSATAPAFAAPLTNPFGLQSGYFLSWPSVADLDGDGDLDVIVGEIYGNMKYYENTGTASNPQFGMPQTNPFGLTATYNFAMPHFTDLDGDGDMDLLVGEYYGGIQYFENTGSATAPSFGAPQANPFGITSAYYLGLCSTADLDGDGDLDLMFNEYGGTFQYQENTGTATSPAFAAKQMNPFGLVNVYALGAPAFGDMDDDGDLDLLVGEYTGNFQYFKNMTISSVQDQAVMANLKAFPNPVQDILWIETDEQIERIEVFNLLGQSMTLITTPVNQIDFSDFKEGFYMLQVTYANGATTNTKVQKN